MSKAQKVCVQFKVRNNFSKKKENLHVFASDALKTSSFLSVLLKPNSTFIIAFVIVKSIFFFIPYSLYLNH